jgi:hypothetical protein
MMKVRRIRTLSAVISLALALAACGGGAGGSSDPASNTPSNAQPGSSSNSNSTTPTQTSPSSTSSATAMSWSNLYNVSSTAASYPDVSVAADGFAVATYVQSVGSSNALFAVTRQANSDQWSTPFNLTPIGDNPLSVTPATGSLITPSANRVVVNRATGDATLVWVGTDLATKEYPAGQSIWIISYIRSTNSWTNAIRLSAASSMPAMAINREGVVAIAFLAPDVQTSATMVQGYVSSGGTTKAFGPVAAGTGASGPQVAIDGFGTVNVAWNSNSGLMTVQRHADNTMGAVSKVSDAGTFSLAGSENGSAIIATILNQQVYTALLPAGSATWQTPVYMPGGTANGSPAVSMNAKGNAALVFGASTSSGTSYYEYRPWIATWSAASNTWTPAAAEGAATAGVAQNMVWLGDDDSVFFSMHGTQTVSFRRAGGSSTWTGTTHDLTGFAPVSAADPVTGKAALVWLATGSSKGLMAESWR